jgi:hypothetical protein
VQYNDGMRRAVAASLLTLLIGSLGLPATCFGWERSAADRLACCKRAHGANCPDQLAADVCCAGQEQSRQPALRLASATPTLVSDSITVAVPLFNAAGPDTLIPLVLQHRARSLHNPPIFSPPPLRI